MKVKRIDMAESLLQAGSELIPQGNNDEGWGADAKSFTFDDEEEDESLKPYNPWE